jgi:hypothetical protein
MKLNFIILMSPFILQNKIKKFDKCYLNTHIEIIL